MVTQEWPDLVICPDCLADLDCWDGDIDTVLRVHMATDCPGPER